MGSNPTQIHIAIIGAGIAGLALAAGLTKKPHLTFHIYESVPAHGDVGAGLALHANAINAMALLGPEVRRAYFDAAVSVASEEDEEIATEVILAQGEHAGEKVAELGRAKGRKSVSRADLLAGLRALVPEERISWGKKLEGIEVLEDEGEEKGGVNKLRFGDGTEARADCVIGADGIHSAVRAYLLGDDHPATKPRNEDGWQVHRTLVPVEEARKQIGEKWTRGVPILLGPRGHVNCIPMNKGTRVSAGVAVRGGALEGGGAKPLDPALYADYTEEAQKIVRMVAKDTSASWSVGDHDHAPFYSRGCVAMMGDAAHASLPFAGNGAAQALEDAAVLDALFGRVKHVSRIEAALTAYDATRRPRSQAVVNLARAFGRVYAYAEGKMHESPQKMRDFFAGAAVFTNEADLQKQNDEAIKLYESFIRGRSRSCPDGSV
jgi:salicylate hydroxylase